MFPLKVGTSSFGSFTPLGPGESEGALEIFFDLETSTEDLFLQAPALGTDARYVLSLAGTICERLSFLFLDQEWYCRVQ